LPALTLMTFLTGLQTAWILIHFVGLAAALMVRTHSGHRSEALAQLVFLASMPMIALATVVGQQLCLTIWPLSAATLAAMIVLATADFSSGRTAITAIDAGN
jgi:hypothetical protein